MRFRLVSKSMTLNDHEQRNGRYFALFQRIRVASGAHCIKMIEDVIYPSFLPQKCSSKLLVFLAIFNYDDMM